MSLRLSPDEGVALWAVLLLAPASRGPRAGQPDPFPVHDILRRAADEMGVLLARRRNGTHDPEADARSLAAITEITARFGINEFSEDPLRHPPIRHAHGGPLVLDDELAAMCQHVLVGVAAGDGQARLVSASAKSLVQRRLTTPAAESSAAEVATLEALERGFRRELREYIEESMAERHPTTRPPGPPDRPGVMPTRRWTNPSSGLGQR